jgi:hypothetical protein
LKKRLRGKLGWLVVGLLIGSLFSGVAVAKILIPPNSVSEKSLTKRLRKKINRAAAAVGAQGVKGDPGPRGASGETPPSPSEQASGLVSPWADEELSRGENAVLSRPDGSETAGLWCIKAPTIDPARMLVQVSPAEEPHVSIGGNEIPIVRWHVYPNACDSREVEIETASFDTLEGDYNRTNSLPFTFVIEEGGR